MTNTKLWVALSNEYSMDNARCEACVLGVFTKVEDAQAACLADIQERGFIGEPMPPEEDWDDDFDEDDEKWHNPARNFLLHEVINDIKSNHVEIAGDDDDDDMYVWQVIESDVDKLPE